MSECHKINVHIRCNYAHHHFGFLIFGSFFLKSTSCKDTFLFSGSQQPHPLQCLAIQGKVVYASYQNVIKAFKRGEEISTYLGHEGEIQFILPFGEHLVSIDDNNVMRIWHSQSKGDQLD